MYEPILNTLDDMEQGNSGQVLLKQKPWLWAWGKAEPNGDLLCVACFARDIQTRGRLGCPNPENYCYLLERQNSQCEVLGSTRANSRCWTIFGKTQRAKRTTWVEGRRIRQAGGSASVKLRSQQDV
eukprot:Pompholyxophrys_sp_v1_NODE_156_length_1477_cov_16.734880.p1 type:complete len:126 gc:universal NODE_156_length_1477_cov_16.734880:885-1262(+)